MLKKIVFTVSIIFSFVLLIFVYSFYKGLVHLSSKTNRPVFYFPRLLLTAKKSPTIDGSFNFLLLGLDPRDDSLEKTETTDTIMLANFNPDLNINLLSIPRDLWDYQLNTKINQIYPLSIGKSEPFLYIQDRFSDITGQPIDRTMIITTQNLIDITNLIGGVDVYLDNGFRDEQYPNPEYISNPQANVPVYVTIEFPRGWIHLDSENISQFVRSRKSSDDPDSGGTDIGRIHRQQLLIDALISKLKTIDYLHHSDLIFDMYRYFNDHLTTNFSDLDLASLAVNFAPRLSSLQLTKIEIPSGNDPVNDIVYHPARFINNQWVFIPQDKDYQRFKQFIARSFNLLY